MISIIRFTAGIFVTVICAMLGQLALFFYTKGELLPTIVTWGAILVFATLSATFSRQSGLSLSGSIHDWNFHDRRWTVVGSYGWPTIPQKNAGTVTTVYLVMAGPNLEHRLISCLSWKISREKANKEVKQGQVDVVGWDATQTFVLYD